MEPIISFAPSHLMIGSTTRIRPRHSASNHNDVDSSMYSEMKELKRPRRSTTTTTTTGSTATAKTFNDYDTNNGNGNDNDHDDDDYGFSEPFGNEMMMMENVEGLIWNETDRSATLVNQNLWQIPSLLTVQYASFCKKLDLSYNCLQTLAGIEYFNCLEELVLDNNNLNDSIRFFYNPFMQILSINKNKLTDLEKFLNEITLKLPGLTYLSMLGNPACPDQLSSSDHDEKDYCRYRSYVIHRMPQLKFLDSTTVKQQERLDAQKRGHYYRLIRLNSDSFVETNRIRDHLFALRDEINRQQQPITPLPFNNENSAPKGAFGKLKHRYTGKHSEGNRFIRNHEL